MKYFNTGPLPLFLGFTCSESAYRRAMKGMGVSDAPAFVSAGAAATTHTLEHPSHGLCCIVCVDPKKIKGQSVAAVAGLMAHEAMHVWQNVLHNMGENKPGAEIEAYAVQWITQCFLTEIQKTKVR